MSVIKDMHELVRLAVDAHNGNVEKFSVDQAQKTLREAAIEANGGSTIIDYRAVRDGKCAELFTLVEEILKETVVGEVTEDEIMKRLVDFRNMAENEQNVFVVEDDSTLFEVAEIAQGTQAIRRQRLGGSKTVTVPTTLKAVKIYEELPRVLAGLIDFNAFIDRVGKSFNHKLMEDFAGLWAKASDEDLGGNIYNYAGTYDEAELLTLIEHVEAQGDKRAVILGTPSALRNLAPSVQGHDSQSDLYNMGYYGSFYGTPTLSIRQRHKVGTTQFVHDNGELTILATDYKPIKCVYEGKPLIIPGNPMANADLTQEYMYADMYGTALVMPGGNCGIGRYKITG